MKKLRNRLYVALLPLQLLLVGLAVWTFFLLANLEELVSDAKSSHEEFAEVLDTALFRLREMSVLVEMTAEVDGRGLRSDIDESRQDYFRAIEVIRLNPHSDDEESMPELIAVNEKMQPRLTRLLREMNDPMIAQQRGELIQLFSNAESLLERLSTAAIDDLLNLQDAFRDRLRLSFAVLGVGILLGVFGTLLISRQIGRMILSPLEELEDNLEEVSSGNLEVEAVLNRRDEIGKLATAFNQMVLKLREYKNLTDQKLLSTTRTFRSVLQRTPHATFFLTSDFKVFFANPPAGELLETPEFKNHLPKQLRKFAQDAMDSGDIVVQDRLQEALRLNIGGQPMYFLVAAFPVDLVDTEDFDSGAFNAEGVAIFLQDVTRMKLADNLKGNVVATVSHELKTPLTSARMSLYLLSEESVGPLNEEQRELVDTAKEDLERQLATIQNLLDLSRIEQSDKRLVKEPCRANAIIERSIMAHRELANSCGVKLVPEPSEGDPYILADAKRVEIVVNNFISNALRHAPEHSDVVVQTVVEKERVRFAVCDEGPGVPEDSREVIFERYAQGEDSRRHGSAGLGLHISKEIIVDHGGEIGCDSVLGQGSNFYFLLQRIDRPDPNITEEPPTETSHA
ncbi:sensor histidine kinase [Cerasicoccus frondis]|uniref:sensor histidine kinase n=1 Tax=Cerasicoccus frondis TaxID=490090 RepID=UPI00285271DC|nr:ATP-binding protein [Cerasicoccus frondis]